MRATSRRSRASWRASATEAAMPTTAMSGSRWSIADSESASNRWSSTNRTRIRFWSVTDPASDPFPRHLPQAGSGGRAGAPHDASEDTSADRTAYPRSVRLAMLGLGLIGGSVGRAAGAAGWRVRAWTQSGDGPRRAAADGIEQATALTDAVRGADLVVLAAPPIACLDLLDRHSADAAEALGHAVATDAASTKVAV